MPSHSIVDHLHRAAAQRRKHRFVARIAIRPTSYWKSRSSAIRQSRGWSTEPWTLPFRKQLPCSVPTSLLVLSHTKHCLLQPTPWSPGCRLSTCIYASVNHVRFDQQPHTSLLTHSPRRLPAAEVPRYQVTNDHSPLFTLDCINHLRLEIATPR